MCASVPPVHRSEMCGAAADADERRRGLDAERVRLSQLAAKLAVPLEPGVAYRLVPRQWLRSWQRYVEHGTSKKGAASLPPRRPDPLLPALRSLLCPCHPHEPRLRAPLPPVTNTRSRLSLDLGADSEVDVVSESDWIALTEFYGGADEEGAAVGHGAEDPLQNGIVALVVLQEAGGGEGATTAGEDGHAAASAREAADDARHPRRSGNVDIDAPRYRKPRLLPKAHLTTAVPVCTEYLDQASERELRSEWASADELFLQPISISEAWLYPEQYLYHQESTLCRFPPRLSSSPTLAGAARGEGGHADVRGRRGHGRGRQAGGAAGKLGRAGGGGPRGGGRGEAQVVRDHASRGRGRRRRAGPQVASRPHGPGAADREPVSGGGCGSSPCLLRRLFCVRARRYQRGCAAKGILVALHPGRRL